MGHVAEVYFVENLPAEKAKMLDSEFVGHLVD